MKFPYKKWVLLLPVVVLQLMAVAQNDSVARAEAAFARYATDSGFKKAFLHFLDSNSIVFHKGKVYNGIQYWKNAPYNNGLLLWKPVYTGIAESGDMGFSTGPSEYRAAASDTVLQSGNYSSVWIKTKQGQWKVLVDIGVPYQPSLLQKKSEHVPIFNQLMPVPGKTNWQMVERNFIEAYQQKGTKAWTPFISNISWFNIQNRQPAHTMADITAALQNIPGNLQFNVLGGNASAAGDMCYAYGTVIHNGNTENYLRVWGHYKDGWKLLLQALKW